MTIAQSRVSHICQLDCSFRARVAKQVALDRMEFRCSDDFCQFFHIDGLYIKNVFVRVNQRVFYEQKRDLLKLWSLIARFHRLILKSSALIYVSPSELMLMELMWYACAFAKTFLGTAATIVSWCCNFGSWKIGTGADGSALLVNDEKAFEAVDEGGEEEDEGEGWKSEVFNWPAEFWFCDMLFSATTLSDFSNTFHSLIVLSVTLTYYLSSGSAKRQAVKLTIRGQEEMRGIGSLAPPNPVDLFFDLQTLEVVKLWFMRLKFGVELVLAAFLWGTWSFKQDYSPAFITRC